MTNGNIDSKRLSQYQVNLRHILHQISHMVFADRELAYITARA
jgi:hypothetical protein